MCLTITYQIIQQDEYKQDLLIYKGCMRLTCHHQYHRHIRADLVLLQEKALMNKFKPFEFSSNI